MKKLFSLLFVAMLSLSAWADMTVTFIPGETVGSNSTATSRDQMTLNGVTITCTTGAFNAAQYRFAAGSTATFTSTVGNIKKVVSFHNKIQIFNMIFKIRVKLKLVFLALSIM